MITGAIGMVLFISYVIENRKKGGFWHDGVKHVLIHARPNKWHEDDCPISNPPAIHTKDCCFHTIVMILSVPCYENKTHSQKLNLDNKCF